MKKEDFDRELGETFRIDFAETPVHLRLAETKALGQGLREGGAFSVVFVGPRDRRFGQGSYELFRESAESKKMGESRYLFLVPIGPFGDGMGYEAVFT